jgi:ribosome-associated protein
LEVGVAIIIVRMSRRAAPGRQPPALPDSELGRVSKSQLKRDATALQKLGAELALMPVARRQALGLPEGLAGAIDELQRTRSHEGRRRQLQYVGKLMRQVDAAPLQDAVAQWRLGGAVDSLQLHEAEQWRERLIADDAAFSDFALRCPGADLQPLRALARQARLQVVPDAAPGQAQRQGRAFRDLHRRLRQALTEAAGGAGAPPEDEDKDR